MSKIGKVIFYVHPGKSSFVRGDLALLGEQFELVEFFFNPRPKIALPWLFVRQFLALVSNVQRTDIFVTQFGGYHSFLPAFFSKMFRKPCLIILGGADCVSFPSIRYGNFNNHLMGWFTKKSYQWSTHLSPVDEALVKKEWGYYPNDFPFQGFEVFVEDHNCEFEVINYGYDPARFQRQGEKKPRSFLTVGYLHKTNYRRKGIDLILELASENPDCSFTIVGGTQKSIPATTVPNNVRFVPAVTHEELIGYYSSHQFYLQLSICEGFPSALCEAMLCECIPIGSMVAAIPKIIDGRGYLLPKRNFEMLHSIVKEALESKDQDKMGASARKRIIDSFPLKVRHRLVMYIKEILGE